VVPPTTADPNDLWTADFKGQFRTGNGVYCYPLTIADQHTRFLLTCHGLLSTQTVTARPVFERAFRAYGLPWAIRTDNGVPFATQAIHGLSFLNVWWMRLGIQHQRIHPGRPQQNGAHERMHRTLKRQAVRPVRRTCALQQRAFDAFRTEYNEVAARLQQATPASAVPPIRGRVRPVCPPEFPGPSREEGVPADVPVSAEAAPQQCHRPADRTRGPTTGSGRYTTVLLATLDGRVHHHWVTQIYPCYGHFCYYVVLQRSGRLLREVDRGTGDPTRASGEDNLTPDRVRMVGSCSK
jgi:hypothetical protein